MELSIQEMMDYLGVQRHQVSRYAKDGRLKRTRHGYYDSASLAELVKPFLPNLYDGTRGSCRPEPLPERELTTCCAVFPGDES
ncbi:MAG: helix-turn-helix domain-containing protein [Kiritimatiellia bacterium]|nr:helix-turn-helix domain-containing protein [Kiritimatiellia bacterium]